MLNLPNIAESLLTEFELKRRDEEEIGIGKMMKKSRSL